MLLGVEYSIWALTVICCYGQNCCDLAVGYTGNVGSMVKCVASTIS